MSIETTAGQTSHIGIPSSPRADVHINPTEPLPRLTVRLMGGLGNQLFQYAFARRLAWESGREVTFDVWNGFRRDPYGRELRLSAFTTQVVPAPVDAIPRGMGWTRPWHRIARAYWLARRPFGGKVVYERRPFGYDEAAIVAVRGAGEYFHGHWQHERYSAPIRDPLLRELHLREPLREPVRIVADEILAGRSVSVHIRDYRGTCSDRRTRILAERYYETCGTEYFARALASLGCGADTWCYVFSDNIERAKAIMPCAVRCRYVSEFAHFSEAEEMTLIAKCQHHIISNSTFSWWGAWLSTSPDKKVVAPRRWMRRLPEEQVDICPQDWIRL